MLMVHNILFTTLWRLPASAGADRAEQAAGGRVANRARTWKEGSVVWAVRKSTIVRVVKAMVAGTDTG